MIKINKFLLYSLLISLLTCSYLANRLIKTNSLGNQRVFKAAEVAPLEVQDDFIFLKQSADFNPTSKLNNKNSENLNEIDMYSARGKPHSEIEVTGIERKKFLNYIRPALQQRTQTSEAIKELFLSEQRNTTWASSRENELFDLTYSNEYLSTLPISTIQCKTTICSTHISTQNMESENTLELLSTMSNHVSNDKSNYASISNMNFHILKTSKGLNLYFYDNSE